MAHIYKAQNYSLAKTYFHILKPLTHGKYKLLIPQKYLFMGTMLIFFHNQLTTKAHVYHPWQNYSFSWDEQVQRSSTTRPSWASLAHMQISATEAHVSYQVKFQHNLTAGVHYHQFRLVKIRSEEDTCLAGVKPFLAKLMWHKDEVTWHKVGKLQPTIFPFFSNQFSQRLKAAITRPWKLLK